MSVMNTFWQKTRQYWNAIVDRKLAEHKTRLRGFATLEDRVVPVYSGGSGPGEPPIVQIYNTLGVLVDSFPVYEESYTGGVRTFLADINIDGTPDLIVGTEAGGGPRVRVFNGMDPNKVLLDFFAFESTFLGGITIGAGPIGDGKMGIVVGADAGGSPRVVVFDSAGNSVQNLFAFEEEFTAGVRVAIGTDSTGRPAIIAGRGPGSTPDVNVIDIATGNLTSHFLAYDSKFTGGVYVASSEINHDAIADIVTGPGVGGGPHIRAFDGVSGQTIVDFFAGNPSVQSGANPSIREVDGEPNIGVSSNWYNSSGTVVESGTSGERVVGYSRPLWTLPSVSVVAIPATDPLAGGVTGFQIWRSGSTGDLPLTYTLTGTAQAGVDFVAPSGSITIPDGNEVNSVVLQLTSNSPATGNETIGLTVSSTSSLRIVPPPALTPLTLAPSGSNSLTVTAVDESGLPLGFRFVRNDKRGIQSFPYLVDTPMIPNVDFVPLSGTVTFPAGVDSVTIPFIKMRDGFSGTITIDTGFSKGTVVVPPGPVVTPNDLAAVDKYRSALDDIAIDLGKANPDFGTIYDGLSGAFNDLQSRMNRRDQKNEPVVRDLLYRPSPGDLRNPSMTLEYKEPFVGFREDGTYVPPQPSVQRAQLYTDGLGNGSAFADHTVRYSDGAISLRAFDFGTQAGGFAWGSERNWSNKPQYSLNGRSGNGWSDSYLPFVIHASGSNTIAAVFNGTQARLFDFQTSTQTYEERNGRGGRIAGLSIFTLTMPDGSTAEFWGHSSDPNFPAKKFGSLKKYTDLYGQVVEVMGYTTTGMPTEIRRSTPNGPIESLLFNYINGVNYINGGVNADRTDSITLRQQQPGESTWTILRKSIYEYYDGATLNGTLGDLKRLTIQDAANAIIDQSFYRYYKDGDANGYAGGLKMVLNPDSYRRLLASGITNPETANDSQIAPFADQVFQYNAMRYVSQVTTAGQGTSTFAYTRSTNSLTDPTFWAMKTVETLPDSTQRIVFSNSAGRTLLNTLFDPATGTKSSTFYQLDGNHRVTRIYSPETVLGYSEILPDLLGLNSNFNNSIHLADDRGLVSQATIFNGTTTATDTVAGHIKGFVQSMQRLRGELGKTIESLGQINYFTRSIPGGVTGATIASETDANGATTKYTYDWFAGTQVASKIQVTLPAVLTAQNGSNQSNSYTFAFDQRSRPTWIRDEVGVLTTVQYGATGDPVQVVQDVNTGQLTAPYGWTTPANAGQHYIWGAVRDAFGRVTKTTDANGSVAYITYNDAKHEIRLYNGWNNTTNRPTEPTQIVRRDPLGYTEYLSISDLPSVANGAPTGAESFITIQSLTRIIDNAAGQTIARDDYSSFNGTSYSPISLTLGSVGTNYLRTEYGYGVQGLLNRIKTPDGRITRTVRDGFWRVASEWTGASDTPASGVWSPTNAAGMVKVVEYQYDSGGSGSGNLTKITIIPGNGAANRVTTGTYDWRNRLVAVKDGVASSEAITVNRPLTVYTYDGLDQVTNVSVYDGDGFTPTIKSNGELNGPDWMTIRSKTDAYYDSLGRVFETKAYLVDSFDYLLVSKWVGQPYISYGTADRTRFWYDERGNVVKISEVATDLGDQRTRKAKYDSLNRLVSSYITEQYNDGPNSNNYANAVTLLKDTVFAQTDSAYDNVGRPIQTTTRVRTPEASGFGALQSLSTQPNARVSYDATYYDAIGRAIAFVDVGTNGNSAWTRPSTVPGRSDAVHVWSVGYDPAGMMNSIVDPRNTKSVYGYDLLGRMTKSTGAYQAIDIPPYQIWDRVTTYSYNAQGQLASIVEPGNRESRPGYDAWGRMTSWTDRYGTKYQRTSSVTLNNIGDLITITDPLGTKAKLTYDGLGRTVGATVGDGLSIARNYAATYDTLGRPLSLTDPRGFQTNVSYNDRVDSISVTDPLGNSSIVNFDELGRMTSAYDPLNKLTSVSYDRLDRMTSVTDPLSHTTTFAYLLGGTTDRVTDPMTFQSTVSYDSFGRAATITDPRTYSTTVAYDRNDNVTSVTDANLHTNKFTYNRFDELVQVFDADDQSTTFSIDSQTGDLLAMSDRMGRVTQFGYDTAGRMNSQTDAAGTADALTTSWTLDKLDRTTSVTAPGNRETLYGYNEFSEPVTITEGYGTSLARSTNLVYDNAGNLTDIINPLGTITRTSYDALNRPTQTFEAFGTSEQISSSVTYDPRGLINSITNANGKTTTATYDDAGRLTTVTNPLAKSTTIGYDNNDRLTSVTNALNKSSTFGYDAAGNLTWSKDALNNQTSLSYDNVGNVLSVTDPRNKSTTYGYDTQDRLTTVTNALTETTTFGYDLVGNPTTVTNARGAIWETKYDNLDRPTASIDPLTHSTTYAYSPTTGDLASVTDALGKSTTFGYDSLGRQTTVTQPISSGVTATTKTDYDAIDRVTMVTNPLGFTTSVGYDKLNRPTTLTDALGKPTTFGYDNNGNRTWLQDAVGNKTVNTYDDNDRLTKVTTQLGNQTTYGYDVADRLTSVTDALSRKRQYGYDDADRLTSEKWYNASNSLLQTQSFGYDAASNLTSATDPDGSYTIAYDDVNRAKTVTGPFGVTQTFGYDLGGNRISATDNKGGTTSSTFDLANRLTSRTLSEGSNSATLNYGYSDRNELTVVTRLSGSTTVGTSTYGHDDGGRLTGITHQNASGTTLASYSYGYDLANQMTSKTENGTTTTYAYDKIGQLTQDGATTFTYDAAGNRTMSGYTATAGNENRTTQGNGWTYGYDAVGNVTSKGDGTTSWSYTYDLNNQMTKAVSGSTTVNYAYDAFGNRISRTQGSTVERFVYDGWDTALDPATGSENFNAVADLNSSNAVTSRRLFGPDFDFLGAKVDSSGSSFYLMDNLGSVRQVTNSTGTVTGTQNFDSYGNKTSSTGTVDRYGYTGREWDSSLGLQYSRARMYDPGIGRWTSTDPLGFGGGDANLYRYVGNGPTNATDPSGMVQGTDAQANAAAGELGGMVQGTRDSIAQAESEDRERNRSKDDDVILAPMPSSSGSIRDGQQRGFQPTDELGGGSQLGVMEYDRFGNPIRRNNPAKTKEDVLNDFLSRQTIEHEDGSVSQVQTNRNGLTTIQTHGPSTGIALSSPAPSTPSKGNPRGGTGQNGHQKFMGVTNDDGSPSDAGPAVGNRPKSFAEEHPSLADLGANFNLMYNPYRWFTFGSEVIQSELTRQKVDGQINQLHRENGREEIARSSVIYDIVKDGEKGLKTGGKVVLNETAKFAGSTVTFGLWQPGDLIAYTEEDKQNRMLEMSKMFVAGGLEAGFTALTMGMGQATRGGKIVGILARGLEGNIVKYGIHNGVKHLVSNGNYQKIAKLANFLGFEACFAAGTPIRTPGGSKPIEAFAVGDQVLSRDEFDASGSIETKVVEELFIREALVWNLHLGEQVIRTTAEHPFYVLHKGWTACNLLTVGDRVLTEGGSWSTVTDLLDTGDWETVYNFRIADHHTYFVGDRDDGTAVWAHNANYVPGNTPPKLPSKVIASVGELIIEHYFHGGNDHGPAHLHIYDGKKGTRIGAMGKPGIFRNDPELTSGMKKIIDDNKEAIRSAVNKIHQWIMFERQVHGGIRKGVK